MSHEAGEQVEVLLDRLRAGEEEAFDELFPLLYDELRQLARRQRIRWDGDYTLNTTAILHEAYLKLADGGGGDWQSRAHFLHAASRVMRHVLINYAERRRAKKRGGGRPQVPVDGVAAVLEGPKASPGEHDMEALLGLDQALDGLAGEDSLSCEIVECRVFGGMTIRETAEALGVSEATISRRWTVAQAWLRREMTGEGQ